MDEKICCARTQVIGLILQGSHTFSFENNYSKNTVSDASCKIHINF